MTHPGAQYLAEQTIADVVEALEHEPVSSFPDFTDAVRSIISALAAEKARADAAEAERDALKAEKWRAQHVDTMNDIASLRVALECAEATVADLAAKLQAAEAEHRFSLGLVDNAQATIASLTEQLAEARETLKPFAAVGRIIDGPFGPALFAEDDQAFKSGCAWKEDGETKTLTWGQFRRARATLSRLEKQEGEA